MKKNIVVITPVYKSYFNEEEDTLSVFYLVRTLSTFQNVKILHIKNYKFFDFLISLFRKNKEGYFKDSYFNDGFKINIYYKLPKNIKFGSQQVKSANYLIKTFYSSFNFSPDIYVIHFPTLYCEFNFDSNKCIAIIHSHDLFNIKRSYSIKHWNLFFNKFSKIGFRSVVIKENFYKLINYIGEDFLAFSGIPASYFSIEKDNKVAIKNDIVTVAKLNKNKNIISILKALSRLLSKYEFQYTIVGNGNLEKSLKSFSKKYIKTISINFINKLPRSSIVDLLRKNSIFIMTSFKETFGLVYLEAMASGCITIGSIGQGIDGIIIDGFNGFLVNPYSIKQIEDTLIKIFNLSQNERSYISTNGFNTAKAFDETLMNNYYMEQILNI